MQYIHYRSGSSANLVMAVELAKLKISPENKVVATYMYIPGTQKPFRFNADIM